MKLLNPIVRGLPKNASISRASVSDFISSLVPGEYISSSSIHRIARYLGFEERSIMLSQVGHFYLLITLKQLLGYTSYKKLILNTKITVDADGDSSYLQSHWNDVKSADGLSKIEFNEKLFKFYMDLHQLN